METFEQKDGKTAVELIVKTWRKVNDNEVKSYWPVVFFGNSAPVIVRRFEPGRQIYVEGIPDIRVFAEGNQKFQVIATSFILLDGISKN